MISNKQVRHEAKQLFRLCLVNSLLDENRVRDMVRQVIASSHRGSLPVLTHFLHLLRLHRAQHTAKVESAAPLSPELQATTNASLTRLYGPGLTTIFSDQPSLIGGMRIQVGSDVYDGSVLGGLAALQARL
ncbi:MAG TPA: F0F1 ATP synthase subunit delta [Bryobacteraceae bacterium]|jgi:F-type H+-transporting ATPase subunit delta|nr:F0F1 ATP synthase subunit delta [Bryobacteraceae bacterium]